MDWIEDKHSRIHQLNTCKHGVKVSKAGNYQTVPKMTTSEPTFKKLSFLAILKLIPQSISSSSLIKGSVFAKFGYF